MTSNPPEPAPKCTMGWDCERYGTCYAEAHGRPEECPLQRPKPAPEHLHTLDDDLWQALEACRRGTGWCASRDWSALERMALLDRTLGETSPECITPEGRRHLDAVQELARGLSESAVKQLRCSESEDAPRGLVWSGCEELETLRLVTCSGCPIGHCRNTPLGRATLRAREEMDRGR